MLSAKFYTDTFTAGETKQRLFVGAAFMIISATGPVNVRTDKVNLEGLIAGQGFEKQPYQRLEITDGSGAGNTIRYVIADEGFIAGLSGNMSISSMVPVQSSSFANTAKTVTTASAQLFAANLARRYILVQNKDTSGTIYLNWGAGAATVANGIKVGPGGAYELSDTQSTQAMQAIGDAASNTNILVVEG